MDITIYFNSKNKDSRDELALKSIISNNTDRIIDSYRTPLSPENIQNRVFEVKIIIYKTIPRHEETIIKHTEYYLPDNYRAKVELIDFNSKNIYNAKLRSDLEYLANHNFSGKELSETGKNLAR